MYKRLLTYDCEVWKSWRVYVVVVMCGNFRTDSEGVWRRYV